MSEAPRTEPSSDALPESLKDLLAVEIEGWMDVLLVGLSPDLLPAAAIPSHLATVRSGGQIPSEPWDAVFIRFDPRQPEAAPVALQRAVQRLRHGGAAALVVLPPGEGREGLEPMLRALGGTVESRRAEDGSALVLTRKTVAGEQDLVGLRRAVRTLARAPERLEVVLADVRSREAGRRPPQGGWSVKEVVGHLGDLDKDGWSACIRQALGDGPARPPRREHVQQLVQAREHNSRTLVELLIRFRHFRWQSLEDLERLDAEAWLRTGRDLDGREITVAEMVRLWVREEEGLIQGLGNGER